MKKIRYSKTSKDWEIENPQSSEENCKAILFDRWLSDLRALTKCIYKYLYKVSKHYREAVGLS